jgi:hypothetical protein
MRWFRRNKAFGAQPALFALALQFALAFGHFHGSDPDHAAVASAAIGDLAREISGSPAPSDHGTPADETCAICATVHLIGAAQVAASPTLPLPVDYSIADLSPSSDKLPGDLRYFDLRSRGPPQA